MTPPFRGRDVLGGESTFTVVAQEANPVDLLEREPDERLLAEDASQLPASAGSPEPLPAPGAARRRIVGTGAALTGLSLVIGAVLIVTGIVAAVSGAAVLSIVGFAAGVSLIATHWGWVHVAELTATKLDSRRDAPLHDRRAAWLRQISPYPRWEVSTSAGEDGSITILTVCHRPVIRDEGTFSFLREEVGREVHPAEEPAAAVTERAELLRGRAAAQTQEAREDYEAARAAYEDALLTSEDEHQRRAALHAASQALSERINSNLRDPPLIE